jgi:EAL domain-containing protein (putative c-di-GMP-specific phosphodiesterase class I)
MNLFDLDTRLQIAALLVLMLMGVDYARNRHLNLLSTRTFKACYFFTIGCLLLDVASVYVITHAVEVPPLLTRATNQLFFVALSMTFFLVYLYIEVLAHEQQRIGLVRLCVTLIPLVVSLAFTLFGELYYSMDATSAYAYGPMPRVVSVCGLVYILAGLKVSFDKTVDLALNQRVSIRLGLLVCLAAGLVELLWPHILATGLGLALEMLSLYFSFENQKDNIERETGLFNVNAFHRMLEEYAERGRLPYVISIISTDIDLVASIGGAEAVTRELRLMGSLLHDLDGRDVFRPDNPTVSTFVPSNHDKARVKKLLEELDDTYVDGRRIHAIVTSANLGRYVKTSDEAESLLSFYWKKVVQTGGEGHANKLGSDDVTQKSRRDAIVRLLQEGLQKDGFEMFYQPIYNVERHGTHSVEALVRLKDTSTLGFVSPEEFIPIAEEEGDIIELGQRVFELVANDMNSFDLARHGVDYVEVNLSRLQSSVQDMADEVMQTMTNHGVGPSMINLEVTETARTDSSDDFGRNVTRFRELGFTLSLDDFGTGYSNLAEVSKTHYDLIKLDKTMVWPVFDHDIPEKDRDAAEHLLLTSIAMVKAMGTRIVAEGVETQEMADYLSDHGVNLLQGYLYARPLPCTDLIDYLESHR